LFYAEFSPQLQATIHKLTVVFATLTHHVLYNITTYSSSSKDNSHYRFIFSVALFKNLSTWFALADLCERSEISKARRRANLLKKKVLSASNIGGKTDKDKGDHDRIPVLLFSNFQYAISHATSGARLTRIKVIMILGYLFSCSLTYSLLSARNIGCKTDKDKVSRYWDTCSPVL
jgi:hypothetical protein